MASRETQLRIVESAVRLFNEFGTASVSTNRIASSCGLSKGNLHYHFRNKREIIQHVYSKIVDEMDAEWRTDPEHPTLRHMAAMFARQAILSYTYRFFYREMHALLRSDPLLMRRHRENWARRAPVLEAFFLALSNAGILNLCGRRSLIRSLVQSTWIISDNWLNSADFLGREISMESVMSGYELILDIFRPYFASGEHQVINESRAAISGHSRLAELVMSH
jgi:AcrR family transcriptional regulator